MATFLNIYGTKGFRLVNLERVSEVTYDEEEKEITIWFAHCVPDSEIANYTVQDSITVKGDPEAFGKALQKAFKL